MSARALTAILPVLLVLFLLPTASQANVEALPIEDHFDGSIDSMKWTALQNVNSTSYPAYGGSITVSNSAITLSSDGSSFPCIYTAENFFPSGDFAVEFDIKYIRLAGCGTGLWISSENFKPVTNMPYGNVFQVWADTHEEWGSGTKVFLLGQRIHFEAPNWDNHSLSTNTFLFRLSYAKGIYTATLNGTVIGQAQSNLRPEFIAFGHPPCNWVPFSGPAGWTSFKIDSIKILPPSSLTLTNTPSSENIGNEVDIIGILTDQDNKPLPGKTVVLSYLISGVQTWVPLTSTTTDSEGSFSVTWKPDAVGNFLMGVEWAGDAANAGTHETRNVSIARATGEVLLMAESNSTLSELTFNSTSKEIAFTVRGPEGTTGYTRFLVSKALVDNSSDFKVYIDGNQIQYVLTSEGGTWSLNFQYRHSSHSVVVRLPSSSAFSASEGPSRAIAIFVIVAVGVLGPAGVVIYLKKRKR